MLIKGNTFLMQKYKCNRMKAIICTLYLRRRARVILSGAKPQGGWRSRTFSDGLTNDASLVRSSLHSDFDVAQFDTSAPGRPAEKAPSEAPVESRAGLSLLRHYLAFCRVQHIFYKYPVPLGRFCYHHMGYSSDEFAVLNDGRARHECVQVGTTHF